MKVVLAVLINFAIFMLYFMVAMGVWQGVSFLASGSGKISDFVKKITGGGTT